MCGHPLVEHEMACPACAELIKGDARVCRHCGTSLLDDIEVTNAADTNGFAIASLAFGIFFLAGVGSVLAIACGLVARRQIDRNPGQQGRGMALAGIILGAAWLAVLIPATIAGSVGWLD